MMLHDVFDSLRAMTLLHLLLAFIACIGYMLAEGRLLPPRLRMWAGIVAATSALIFVLEAPQWTIGAMLVALAIGAVGLFTAIVWGLSAMLGLRRSTPLAPSAAEAGNAAPERRVSLPTRPGPLHSH
jgi:hypothetical protein